MRLEGTAGTGKSHVINVMCSVFNNHSYLIAAPTGRAAHNVCGVTLHSLLSLGTRVWKETLTNEPLKRIQDRFLNVKYLIIDEYSMVGAKMMNIIDKRLLQVTGKQDKLFGGLNIILVGDTKQLPPVKDVPLWAKLSNVTNDKAKEGILAFKQFEKVVNLTRIVRQEGEQQKKFCEVLLRLRIGMSTMDDYEFLSRRITTMTNDAARFKNSIYLMHSNEEVRKYNLEKLAEITNSNQKICHIKAYHNAAQAKSISADLMLGLESELLLARVRYYFVPLHFVLKNKVGIIII